MIQKRIATLTPAGSQVLLQAFADCGSGTLVRKRSRTALPPRRVNAQLQGEGWPCVSPRPHTRESAMPWQLPWLPGRPEQDSEENKPQRQQPLISVTWRLKWKSFRLPVNFHFTVCNAAVWETTLFIQYRENGCKHFAHHKNCKLTQITKTQESVCHLAGKLLMTASNLALGHTAVLYGELADFLTFQAHEEWKNS